MGHFRFRKQIKILPGLKLNINKKSVSVTAGVRGAHYTVNSRGYRTASVGLPGTGLSYRDDKRLSWSSKPAAKPVAPVPAVEPEIDPTSVTHPAQVFEEVWSQEVNGTALSLVRSMRQEGRPYTLFARDAAGQWWAVSDSPDEYLAHRAAEEWVVYLQNGGTVESWFALFDNDTQEGGQHGH